MEKLSNKLAIGLQGRHIMWCPGCDSLHAITVSMDGWQFDGDTENPSFNPSILVRGKRFTATGEREYKEWQEQKYPKLVKDFDTKETVCHSFITKGKWNFLADCTHNMAGKTVDMVDLPDWVTEAKA